MREYAARRGWTIAIQVKEVGSGASERQLREKLLEAARRRQIDVVLVWRLDRWGRSVADLLATLQELDHLGVGFVSLTEALDLTTPAGRAMAALLAVFEEFEREILRERVRAGLAHARQKGEAIGPAGNCGTSNCRNPETPSRGHHQIRDRPPVADRSHLRSPDLGVTYLSEKWSAFHAVRLANLFIEEFATNMRAKIPTLGFSRKELLILMWRELEVAVDLAAVKLQIQLPLVLIVRG
jgi:hypothetical protein